MSAEKIAYQFEDFLAQVSPEYKDFVSKTHEALMQGGYKAKIENKATGMFVSYSHGKTKRAFLNLFFRKKGLQSRVYAEGHKGYLDFIGNLPDEVVVQIDKAKTCDSCAPTCTKGYGFSVRGKDYYKCRYGCFHIEVNTKTLPVIADLIRLEKESRR